MLREKDIGAWAAVRAALTEHQPWLAGPTDKTRAAVAAVIGPVGDEWRLLFIERARHPDDPWSGHIAFPGGRIEADDASARAAAERETLEEVGLDLGGAEYWGQLDDVTGQMLPVVVSAFVYGLPASVELVPNHEVGTVFWSGAEALCDPERQTELSAPRSGRQRVYPALDLLGPDRPLLWGLTFRLVRQLVGWFP